jgi:hypothetical protein
MVKKWLTQQTTVEESEIKHLVKDERPGSAPVPFGMQNREWVKFKRQIKDGDELWEFCSPPKSWEDLCGRAGICIVRDGEIIDTIVTIMN